MITIPTFFIPFNSKWLKESESLWNFLTRSWIKKSIFWSPIINNRRSESIKLLVRNRFEIVCGFRICIVCGVSESPGRRYPQKTHFPRFFGSQKISKNSKFGESPCSHNLPEHYDHLSKKVVPTVLYLKNIINLKYAVRSEKPPQFCKKNPYFGQKFIKMLHFGAYRALKSKNLYFSRNQRKKLL